MCIAVFISPLGHDLTLGLWMTRSGVTFRRGYFVDSRNGKSRAWDVGQQIPHRLMPGGNDKRIGEGR